MVSPSIDRLLARSQVELANCSSTDGGHLLSTIQGVKKEVSLRPWTVTGVSCCCATLG